MISKKIKFNSKLILANIFIYAFIGLGVFALVLSVLSWPSRYKWTAKGETVEITADSTPQIFDNIRLAPGDTLILNWASTDWCIVLDHFSFCLRFGCYKYTTKIEYCKNATNFNI